MTFTRELWLAGSRIGYSADIDHNSSSSDDDVSINVRKKRGTCCRVSSSETTTASAAASTETSSTSSPLFQFYKDVQPRRRRRLRGRRRHNKQIIMRTAQHDVIHPDIDLSLVSLLTSKEHDRRQFKKLQKALWLHHRGNISIPERLQRCSSRRTTNIACHQDNKNAIEDDSYSSSSSSSSEGSEKYCNNIIKTEHEYSKALSHPPKNNRPIAVIDYGSVQFGQLGSVLDSIYKIGGDKGADDKISRPSIGEENFDVKSTSSNFSTQPAMTVASSRSSEVAAVIASLKNPSADMKRKANYDEDRSAKKSKSFPPAVHKTVTTTLEDAVAFSPYARVLFTATFPQTVVHINAAYGTLVKKGFAKPCVLGRTLTATNSGSHSFEDSSELDEETVSKIVTNDLGISTKKGINYQLFPIISGDESFCDYSRTRCSYELGETAEEVEGKYSHVVHRHVSHYLLQIEPVAQLSGESRL